MRDPVAPSPPKQRQRPAKKNPAEYAEEEKGQKEEHGGQIAPLADQSGLAETGLCGALKQA
jgi:hypothetical protein